VETKAGHFHPERFEDHYETALKELIDKKSKGLKIAPRAERAPAPVIDLMEALRRSAASQHSANPAAARPKSSKKRISGQKEMLLPISGKKAGEEARKPVKQAGRQRRAS
jgi:DNA end-binding protein Ku